MKYLPLCLLLFGCSITELDTRGRQVMIVDSMAAQDAFYFEPLGEVHCAGMISEDYCRNELRNRAGAIGADIVRITSKAPDYCGIEFLTPSAPKSCMGMSGEAFRKIPKAMAAAPPSCPGSTSFQVSPGGYGVSGQ